MHKVKLLYNPISGDRTFRSKLDIVFDKFQTAGYQVIPYRSMQKGDMDRGLVDIDDTYEFLLVAGGDGTIHEVVNSMMKSRLELPLGIFPTGTANDFANHIRLPHDIEACCEIFLRKKICQADLGKANEQYFINVACGGLFTNISPDVGIKSKPSLGKLAYYLKGIEQLQNFKGFKLRMSYETTYLEEDAYLFLVLNGSSAGGFEKLANMASISDGYFDVLVFRVCPLPQMANIFIKILRGEHFDDPNVIYFQTNDLNVAVLENEPLLTDLDGETGPACPLHITLLPKRVSLLTDV